MKQARKCSRKTSEGSLPPKSFFDPALVLEVAVDPVEVERDPADPALRERDPQIRELPKVGPKSRSWAASIVTWVGSTISGRPAPPGPA